MYPSADEFSDFDLKPTAKRVKSFLALNPQMIIFYFISRLKFSQNEKNAIFIMKKKNLDTAFSLFYPSALLR